MCIDCGQLDPDTIMPTGTRISPSALPAASEARRMIDICASIGASGFDGSARRAGEKDSFWRGVSQRHPAANPSVS
jgi:hypothetical protein